MKAVGELERTDQDKAKAQSSQGSAGDGAKLSIGHSQSQNGLSTLALGAPFEVTQYLHIT
jgi:hypothetical protein